MEKFSIEFTYTRLATAQGRAAGFAGRSDLATMPAELLPAAGDTIEFPAHGARFWVLRREYRLLDSGWMLQVLLGTAEDAAAPLQACRNPSP